MRFPFKQVQGGSTIKTINYGETEESCRQECQDNTECQAARITNTGYCELKTNQIADDSS